MDCKQADGLMMKYMDGVMSEEEASRLGEHVESCATCKEAFTIYDMMMDDFSEFELIPAPDNFSMQVMGKIKALPSAAETVENRMENISSLIWGTFSVLLGIATLIFLNRETILNYMIANESLEPYARLIEANTIYFETIFANAQDSLYMMTAIFNAYLAESRYVILAILVILVSTQIYIHRKEKVGV